MPQSARSGVFDPDEIVRNVRISDDAERGYLFYLQAVKPSP